jgi:hypothetical protein
MATNISYGGPGTGITPELDPVNVYATLFGHRTVSRDVLRRTIAEKRSVLDFARKSLQTYVPRMGGEDRQRMEGHLDSVRVLERRLGLLEAPAACPLPAAPAAGLNRGATGVDFNKIATYPPLIRAHMDLVHAAARCDLTRVTTLILTDYNGDYLVYPWLGSSFLEKNGFGASKYFHEITHTQDFSTGNRDEKIVVDRWYFEQVAYLLERFASTPEGASTMLDNTAVVVTNGMGHNHSMTHVPYMIFGSCGGYFKTGRFLKYGPAKGTDNPPGLAARGDPHNRLLVSLAAAMDVDATSFGDKRYAEELSGLRG